MNYDLLLNKVAINRTGIFLNFLAGFLLAPELIGLERMRKIEDNLERFFGKIKSNILPVLEKISKGDINYLLSNPIFALTTLFLGFAIFVEVGLLTNGAWINYFLSPTIGNKIIFFLNLVLYMRLLFAAIKQMYLEIKTKPKDRDFYFHMFGSVASMIIWSFLFPVYFYLLAVFFISSRLIWLVMLAFANSLSFLVRIFIKLLEGDSGLKQLLIPLGLAFYVLGNLLQFFGA